MLVLLFLTKLPVQAASEFTTTFTSTYTISSDGQTQVSHTIALKNNLAHIYATDYTLSTSGDHLTHITASDESGPISTTTSVQGGNTTIHLVIDRPAIGKDKVKTFTLNYQTIDVLESIGDTTTINIPRLARANEAESYTRIVKVENQPDRPSLIYPPPNSTIQEEGTTVYTFIGHPADSLTLLFGDSVTYKLNLSYELKNKELNAVDSELALPPDTSYQHVLLDSLVPPPVSLRLDEDGNWLARYSLKPQEKLGVQAVLYATVYPQPSRYDASGHELYKKSHAKYWDTSSSIVKDLAAQLKTPENIYNYLVTNFTYNYAGVTSSAKRLGASAALASPTLVLCTEFTDTFVALARSSGIPAREINGYAFTTNSALRPTLTSSDVLHAWPEYYDEAKNTWVAIDPTWGNTTGGINYFNKLDFSHIAFVRHGVEDSYPLPAGAYKDNPQQKSVEVEVTNEVPGENPSYEIRDNVIYNIGNVALVNTEVMIGDKTITLTYLPPYGSVPVEATTHVSLYDKIKALCANLFSKLQQLLRASTPRSTY